MSPRKPVLFVAVDPQVKAAFVAAARDRYWSESRLMASIVDDFLGRSEPILVTPVAAGVVKTEDVRVRLTPQKYDVLFQLARERRWSRSTYLCHLFDVHLSGNPQFCDEELIALRHLTTQISAVGTNINQIARALNTSLDNAHLAQAVDFAELKTIIDLERSAVKQLIRANLGVWSVPK